MQRDVALKILPHVFAGDPDRLARFEREAHALASLNHDRLARSCRAAPGRCRTHQRRDAPRHAGLHGPEQAKGRSADKRGDIWAFGVVLYEMLTGRRPFGGEDTADVIAAVLRQEPDWSALPSETPSGVRELLMRCPQREPRARLRDIGDAVWHLQRPEHRPAAVAATPRWTGAGRVGVALGVLAAVLAGAAGA